MRARPLPPRRGVNEAAGRVLAILFLAPFDGLRFGHLSHHALNARPSERPEFYDPAKRSGLRAAAAFYARLLGGVYLLEVASGPLGLLPRRMLRPIVRWVFYDGTPDAAHMADRAERVLLAPDALGRMRRDALLILARWARPSRSTARTGRSCRWRCSAGRSLVSLPGQRPAL